MGTFRGSSFPRAELVAGETEIEQGYQRLAAALQPLITTQDCVLIGILMGGLIPAARLAGMLTGDFVLDCCRVSRYRGETRGGELEWVHPPGSDIEGRTVLLVDDIYDEGTTLDYVTKDCHAKGAARVISAVLVRKNHDRAGARPDFVGLEVDDRYVFGCGMDYKYRWRHLPALYALKGEPPER